VECLSYCIGNQIDLSGLDNFYKNNLYDHIATKYRDVLKLTHTKSPECLLFIFKNGTVVTWGIKRYAVHLYLTDIKQFTQKPITFRVRDEFIYKSGMKTAIEPHDYFEVDCLTIDQEFDSHDLKLSLSYGFSQSVKLQYFETVLESLIEKYTPLMHALSNKGPLRIGRRKIRNVIGEIVGAKSEMNLLSNFLYHPKYFWQHPTLEEYYIMLERYLHIQRRVNAINHRLNTLNEIFDMFNDYLENRHSHHLECVIIVLITIEILFAAINFHL